MKSLLVKPLVCLFVTLMAGLSSVYGQEIPTIQARFSNPEFDIENRIYSVQVQLKSNLENQELFGFNVRFFYDVELMEFAGLTEFKKGYGVLGAEPKSYTGNAKSGKDLFALSGAAAYVNGGVQLLNKEQPLKLDTEDWITAFKAEFKVLNHVSDKEDFCPSIIWDLKNPTGRGGFMPNVDGIVFTVLEKDPATRQESAPTISSAETFNWEYTNRTSFPYGLPAASQCITLNSVVTSTEFTSQVDYKLYQNKPNPFDTETLIGFVLPKKESVRLRVFDVAGKTILEKRGGFPRGYNSFRIENEGLFNTSNLLFYQIETDGFQSKVLKMNLIKR